MDFLAVAAGKLADWWAATPTGEILWLIIGFSAQLMFSMRFIVQWVASERARRSIVPETFWYFSFLGGAMLFAYAIYRVDPVFILGQGSGLLIYARNIHFIWSHKKETAAAALAAARSEAEPAKASADGSGARPVVAGG